ncbi:SPFH/Band 7/PHB domain protein [Candidatus Babeliales bacterium]|nr:SPFH/Band 7/PHB domain protein [Candidatus Babeliales bacterium]MBP9844297.1 SPFH/Band 7/PHB domain protein [Candidatus Babeliales bacterium]
MTNILLQQDMVMYLFFIIPVLFLIGLLLSSVILVKQAETIVIERLGKFYRILGPGLHVIVPFLDQKRNAVWTFVQVRNDDYYRVSTTLSRIDLREAVYDFPKQNVITKDNVTMEINALLYYQITDVKAAMYEVSNLPEAIEKLTQTTLRNVIGSMDLDTSLTSRDAINERLRLILDEATDKWGVKVNRVELQEVNPPHDIRAAMEKQMRAERSRRATILEAEGSKFAMILDAEGVKESQVLRAQGQAEAAILEAEGQAQSRLKVAAAEAKAFEMLQAAMPNTDPAQYLIAMKYMQALPKMMEGQNNKLIVVPYESSALMGSLASMKELFKNIDETSKK